MVELNTQDLEATRPSLSLNTRSMLRSQGFSLIEPPVAVIMLDPAGDGADHHAIVAHNREEWERGDRHEYGFEKQMILRYTLFHRLRADLEFPDILASLLRLHRYMMTMVSTGLNTSYVFGVETNGVGHGYYHMLRRKIGARVIPITTVAGEDEKPFKEKKPTMPRLAGLDWFRYLTESQQVKIERDEKTGEMAPGWQDFKNEMASFVWVRKGRPEALEGQHDDLVLAAALGAWLSTKMLPEIVKAQTAEVAKRKKQPWHH